MAVKWLCEVFCLALTFVTADSDEARNRQHFIYVTVSNNFKLHPMKVNSVIITLVALIAISCSNRANTGQSLKSSPQNVTTEQSLPTVQLNQANISDEVKKKANYFKAGLISEKNLMKLPDEFIDFSKNFISDSLFQFQHIDFNYLVGAIGECDTTIILNSDNWRYSRWDFIKEFTEGSEYEAIEKWDNTVYIADGKIYFEFYLKEIGLIYQIGFDRINAEWYITLYKIDVC